MRSLRKIGYLAALGLLVCAVAPGCAYLQVPRIDPSGERMFAEPPIRTAPPDETDSGLRICGGDVAVSLLPRTVVAPVGAEVVLVAGVCGDDGYLSPNERLEWSLTPGSAGQIVAVGENGPIDWLLGDFNNPRKINNAFAVGSTSRKSLRLGRGTPATHDDVCVEAGQGWITLTSSAEGTSNVTVYAPSVQGWDARMRSAGIDWIDAEWQFPAPAINAAGSTDVLTTTVTRRSNGCPRSGWQVRYEVLDGPEAGFAPDGAQAVVVDTDASGVAGVEVFQKSPRPGTNRIGIRVIRPPPNTEGGKSLEVACGTTLRTWTSADLAVRASSSATASLGSTLTYRIEVSNPGDQPARGVTVTDLLPSGLEYVSANPVPETVGRELRWQLDDLGAGQSHVLELQCRTAAQGNVTNCVRANAAGAAADAALEATACATTNVVASTVAVEVSGPSRATVGDRVTFEILVTNTSQAAVSGLDIRDIFGFGLQHDVLPSPIEADIRPLAPGESQKINVTLLVTAAGRLKHSVEVFSPTADVLATADGSLTAIEAGTTAPPDNVNPPVLPPAGSPQVTVRNIGPPLGTVGEEARFTIELTNPGTQTLTNVEVVATYPAELSPQPVAGCQLYGQTLTCTFPSLLPGQTERFEVACRCLQPATQATSRVVVTTREGAQAQHEAVLDVLAAQGGLTLTVIDLHDPVPKGRDVTYKILVSNKGTTADTNVAVSAIIPVGAIFQPLGTSAPPESGLPTLRDRTLQFPSVPQIAPNETLIYHVVIQTQQAGNLTFQATLTSSGMPGPETNTATTEVWE